MTKQQLPALWALVALAFTRPPLGAQTAMPNAIPEMPAGYNLQAYDDCGAPERQPHVLQTTSHTYTTAEVNADERARSVAWDWKHVDAAYDGLDPRLDYVLAVTYANEAFNNRVQSLWAGGVQIHGPHPLPKGGVERLLFRVPREAVVGGKLSLQFRMEAQVNAVVSVVELWAPAPSPRVLRLVDVSGLVGDLEGKVLDLRYDPVPGAAVMLTPRGPEQPGSPVLGGVTTGPDGTFHFERRLLDQLPPGVDASVTAHSGDLTAFRTIPAADLRFDPVRYRPIPSKVAGLASGVVSLDGTWRIRTDDAEHAGGMPLTAAGWGDLRVPGQWRQQGYDVPQDKHVAMAREFTVPAAWAGRRIFLRFDAIHAGTHYRVNGQDLGYSENLFTPVEWEVTHAVTPGQANRLDLDMVVDTPSERLSYASGYAFHSLGGIDRTVRLYALPPVNVRAMHVAVDLDRQYRDADLNVSLTLDNPGTVPAEAVSVAMALYDPAGKRVALPVSSVAAGAAVDARMQDPADRGALPPGLTDLPISCRVPDPAKWTAEKPALYRLVVDLVQAGKVLESMERRIGFRKIEVQGSRLLVNGKPVKLAGACHHETDPLTGRADTARHAEQDVRLMKDANLNYIRTSHYPPCQELLDAADRIGMYVEVEAPFCWVGEVDSLEQLRQVLTPTSAMVDYCHAHPSVIVWSLANESAFNRLFEASNRLVKALDPSRPTTFNNPDPKRICDIANLHYAPMPYDQQAPGDPRPLFWGEYCFPVCHEQTDVRVDPGLRELWAAGSTDPDSDWGRQCAASFDPAYMRPGVPPGAWTHIVKSGRVLGGAIWAALDEPFYFPDGTHVGYAWVHGFWGIIDAWRRPKPEWWLSKLLYSPAWFPVRRVALAPGQSSVTVPLENRYSFTDLSEIHFTWQLGERKGTLPSPSIAPGATGELALPVPAGTKPGAVLVVRAADQAGRLITAAGIQLGEEKPRPLPAPSAGPPQWHDDGRAIGVTGAGWGLMLDKATLRCAASGAAPPALLAFPMPHVTQYDSGDLDSPYHRPYAVLPDEAARTVESVTASEAGGGLQITVREHYGQFAGTSRWTLDRKGVGRVVYDYAYTGPDMSAREVGLRFLLRPECQELSWRRWSEWAVYPDDSVSRTVGTARAHRDPKLGAGPEGVPPRWPWSLDETELGTADFRSVKLNVYEASLVAPGGAGVRVEANADTHVRACLDAAGVKLHVLSECRLGPVILKTGDHVRGECVVELLSGRK